MTETAPNLVADVLQACAAASPPWRPGEFVRGRSEALDVITFCLESLCRVELLKIVQGNNGDVEGFVLTPRGAELARDPEGLARFCEAEGINLSGEDTPQRRAVRQTLLSPARPRINRVLFWLNIAVFAFGYVLALRQQAGNDFLLPFRGGGLVQNPVVLDVLHRTGMVHRPDILAGEWWRLLTCGFVHFTILHLMMNMYALRILGTDCEWLWGRWRYLILYLLSLLGGSCAALTKADAVVGASGALCGLMAAEAVWLILNRRFLPRRLVRSQLRGLFINGLLITALGFLPNVSGAGHLGGAVAGAVAALLLHWQRFGNALMSRLAIVGLVAFPLLCIVGLKQVSSRDPAWRQSRAERERMTVNKLMTDLKQLFDDTWKLHETSLDKLLDLQPARRDADEIAKAIEALSTLIPRHREAVERLDDAGPFESATFEEFRLASSKYFRLWGDYLQRIQAVLKAKALWRGGGDQVKELNQATDRWETAYRAVRKAREER